MARDLQSAGPEEMMGWKKTSAACAASLFAWIAPAAAQDAVPSTAPDAGPSAAPGNVPSAAPGNVPSAAPDASQRAVPYATPMFTLMDPVGDRSKLDADASIVVPDSGNGTLWHGRVLAQAVTPAHFGGYASISASLADGSGDTLSTLNNLELGGVGQIALSPFAELGVRVGVAIDTPGDEDALVGAVAQAVLRPSDLALAANANVLRLSMSPTFHNGPVFARIDLGLDIALDGNDDDDKLGHVNVGVGYQANRVATTVELQTLEAFGDGGGTLANLGIDLRYVGPVASPYVRLSSAFGDAFDFGDWVGVTVGASFAL